MNLNDSRSVDVNALVAGVEVDVVIEIPRGSFLKRGSTGHVDFISPPAVPVQLWLRAGLCGP